MLKLMSLPGPTPVEVEAESQEVMLRDLLAEIRADAVVEPEAFLLETLVPFGGE